MTPLTRSSWTVLPWLIFEPDGWSHPNWRLGLVVNNVFDEIYETAAFYPQEGINGLVTLRYVPQ